MLIAEILRGNSLESYICRELSGIWCARSVFQFASSQLPVLNTKGCALRSLIDLTLYFYCSERGRKLCPKFSTRMLLVLCGL
jgi:hypothetical protein